MFLTEYGLKGRVGLARKLRTQNAFRTACLRGCRAVFSEALARSTNGNVVVTAAWFLVLGGSCPLAPQLSLRVPRLFLSRWQRRSWLSCVCPGTNCRACGGQLDRSHRTAHARLGSAGEVNEGSRVRSEIPAGSPRAPNMWHFQVDAFVADPQRNSKSKLSSNS